MAKKKQSGDVSQQQYEDWKGETKAEKREAKKAKKMPVHGTGAYEAWKIKAEKAEKETGKAKKKI